MKARCSKLGKYMACPEMLWRDLTTPVPSEPFRNQYTAFGTIVHYDIQTALGCTDLEEPCQEDYIEAEPMLGNAKKSTQLALRELRDYKDAAWLAEEAWENSVLTGHTDLRCTEKDVIIDIKTCTKPPARKQIAIDHYWQLLGYHWLSGATELRVLYVSSKAEWAVLSDTVHLEASKHDLWQLKNMLENPYRCRVYGSACTSCVHVGKCRDSVVPKFPEPNLAAGFVGGGAAQMLGV